MLYSLAFGLLAAPALSIPGGNWETIFGCSGQGQTDERFAANWQETVKNAISVRICSAEQLKEGIDTDCVEMKEDNIALTNLKNGYQDLQGPFKGQCDLNCVKKDWSGPENRLKQMTVHCTTRKEGHFFHACGNHNGLHLSKKTSGKDAGHCEWKWNGSDSIVVQAQMPCPVGWQNGPGFPCIQCHPHKSHKIECCSNNGWDCLGWTGYPSDVEQCTNNYQCDDRNNNWNTWCSTARTHCKKAEPEERGAELASGTIINKRTGVCLDVMGKSKSGANVREGHCHGGKDQRWTLYSNGELVNELHNQCLDVQGDDYELSKQNVQMSECHGSTDQRWRMHEKTMKGEYFQLVSYLDPRICLDTGAEWKPSNPSAFMHSCASGNDDQYWTFGSVSYRGKRQAVVETGSSGLQLAAIGGGLAVVALGVAVFFRKGEKYTEIEEADELLAA